jgi:protein TonB
MLATIERPVTDVIPHRWDAAGETANRQAAFPRLVSTDVAPRRFLSSPSATRRCAAVGLSFLGHVGFLAWLGFASDAILYRAILVQQGQASIQLQASMESTSQRADTRIADPLTFPRTDPANEPLPDALLTPAELEPVEWQPRRLELPLEDQAATPEVTLATRSDLLALPARLERSSSAHHDRPQERDLEPAVTRKASRNQPTFEVRVEIGGEQASVASMPSPASRASDGADSAPAVVYNPAPVYPRQAMLARQTGRVLLRVELARDGSVITASVYRSSGVSSLDQAALEAVRQWRFTPAKAVSPDRRVIGTYVDFEIDEP